MGSFPDFLAVLPPNAIAPLNRTAENDPLTFVTANRTAGSSASGQYLIQGSGALAGLHAEGPFSGTFQTVTYGGQLHFS